MRTTTTLGTPGSFAKSLLKLRLIESLKLVEHDSIFAHQIRHGVSSPATYDQIISDVNGQMNDNYTLVESIVGPDICFMVGKYFRS